MKPVDVHVGTRIRLARNLRAMSQGVLAEALGVTFQQVQRYEQGANRIGAGRLFDLARALDMPIAFFFDGAAGSSPVPSPSMVPAASPLHVLRPGARPRMPQLEPGAPERNEALELIRTYDRIIDPEIRRQVLTLVKTIAPGEELDQPGRPADHGAG